MFSSDAQGALLDTTTTDDDGFATLTVEDGGLVTTAALYVYETKQGSPGSTHLASSLVVTQELSSARLTLLEDALGTPPSGAMLVQIQIPPMEAGWTYVLEDGCFAGEVVPPGTAMVDRIVHASGCQLFETFGAVTVSLWREQPGFAPELVGTAATPWEAASSAVIDVSQPVEWVDATMTVHGDGLLAPAGSWRLSSWEFTPTETESPDSYSVSAPHPKWITGFDAPLPFVASFDAAGGLNCSARVQGQRTFDDGTLELEWPNLAGLQIADVTWQLSDGGVGDYLRLSASTPLGFAEAIWWDVLVPTSLLGYVPPWLEAPAELATESGTGDDLFKNVEGNSAPWRLREHVEYAGFTYADVMSIDFDPLANGVTRFETSCGGEVSGAAE